MRPDAFTVYDMLLRNAQLYGPRPALIDGEEIRTFGDLLGRVDALATGLHALGITHGERVCILAQNDPAYIELYLACARQGIIAYPINWRLSAEEVARVMGRAQPALFVVDASCLESVRDWPGQDNGVRHWVQLDAQPAPGFSALAELYADLGANTPTPAAPDVSPQDPLLVISTAAVDVIPRGAVLTHANVLASNVQTMALMGITEQDVNLVALPLFHIAALGMGMTVLHAGGANVIMARYDAAEAVRLIDTHQVTHLSDFPPVLAGLLDAAEQAGSTLPSLRFVSGLDAAPTIERLQAQTNARFWTGFGQAETTGFVTLQAYDERPGAAGRPGPLARVRVVDERVQDVPTGEPGEIVVRGAGVFQGYYDQPEVNAYTFRGGWHHTGDVGRYDEDGYLHYVGRRPEKELIKPGGENVYPAEVETVILELDGVRRVCVFGVPDTRWGEAVRAVVEADANAAPGLNEQAVIDHVGKRIARFKRPHTVLFTEALPEGENGQVDRAQVKQRWGQAD